MWSRYSVWIPYHMENAATVEPFRLGFLCVLDLVCKLVVTAQVSTCGGQGALYANLTLIKRLPKVAREEASNPIAEH